MQQKLLHKNIYTLSRYACTQETLEKHRQRYEGKVRLWEKLKAEGVSDRCCQEAVGLSRATYYRYKKKLEELKRGILPPTKRPRNIRKPQWGESEKQLVLMLRRQYQYGKEKLAIILRRDHGIIVSASTVGRILKQLSAQGLAPRSRAAPRIKRQRAFRSYAQRAPFKRYADIQLGERVQIDHMSVSKNQTSFKHFVAWERRSRFVHANVYSNAKARTAKRFLEELIERAPFKVLSVQVDGGSEFMGEFEEACAALDLPLYVLPPRSPRLNGGVERSNRTFRDEFYGLPTLLADSLGAMRNELARAVEIYNTYQPHHSLKGKLPMEYINLIYLLGAA